MNGEPQTTWSRCFSNAAIDSVELLPFTGWNISSENGFRICFLMKTVTFHQWFFIHNLMLNTRWVKNLAFFYKCPTRLVSKINSFLDFKGKPIDNKSWEALDATISYMDQWLWGFMCLYNSGTHFLKNQKQQRGRLYTQK